MNHELGQLNNDDYLLLTDSLVALADECCEGRIIAALEGGYSRGAIKGGTRALLKGLMKLESRFARRRVPSRATAAASSSGSKRKSRTASSSRRKTKEEEDDDDDEDME